MEEFVRCMITHVGDDSCREGLLETPARVVKSWGHLFSGYKQDVSDVIKTFSNEEKYDSIVLLKNIEFFSMCEHHILPFTGLAHIGYIPDKHIIGVSKLARILEVFARRLQTQERIAEQVTEALMFYLKPKGAACIIKAKHLCIACRGVEKQHSFMVTSSMKGCFREDFNSRNELLQLIGEI